MRWQMGVTMENNNIANCVNILACVWFKSLRSIYLHIIQMLEVYERAYKICQMLQCWLLSTSTSTKLHRDCGITVCTIKRKVILSNVKQKCGLLPTGSALNLIKLNLIEIELFIKMLYGVWSSLKPDHETKQISAPDAARSPIWNIWRPHIFSLLRISTMMKWFGNVNCVDTKAKNSKNFKFRNTVFLPKNPRY